MAEEAAQLIRKAFQRDDHSTVARLLDENPDFRARINEPVGAFGSPAVTLVKSREMLDVLLAAGADIDAKSRWWAGGFGILDTVQPELAKYAIERGATLEVHSAARLGLSDDLRRMLDEHPALVLARGGDGQTALHFAATVEIAELLLSHGAEIDAIAIDHPSTPAQYAVRSRQDVARYLVSRGCKPDILMAAALGDAALVAEILDATPAAIRTRVSDEYFEMMNSKSGGTIYQWELGWYVSAHQVAKEFGHEDVFDLLISRSPHEVKVLTACWLGDEALLDSLGEHQNKFLPEDERQIAHAARNNDLPAVRLMLRAGLPVTATSQHAATSLHWAAFHGNREMAAELIAHGAPTDAREPDHDGTPLDWARYGSEHGWHPGSGDYAGTIAFLEAQS